MRLYPIRAKACVSGDRGQVLVRAGCGLLLVALSAAACADNSLRLQLARVSHPQLAMEGLTLEFLPALPEQAASFRLRAARMRIDGLGQNLSQVEFDCAPEPVAAAPVPSAVAVPPATADDTTAWRCEGPLRWRGGSRDWRLAWRADTALSQAELRLSQGRSEIQLQLPLANTPFSAQLRRVRAAWLKPLLPQIDWQDGRLDGRIELAQQPDGAARWHGQLRVRALSAQAAGGTVAVAGVELSGPLELRSDARGLRIATTPQIAAGEVLVGSVYLVWPKGSAVALDVLAQSQGKAWQVERFKLAETGFEVEAQASLQPDAPQWLQRLSGRFRIDLGSRYGRYLDSAMASLGQTGLIASGVVDGNVELGQGGRLQALATHWQNVGLSHPDGRYAIAGLTGDLAFAQAREANAAIDLRWQHLAVHALKFDPGRFQGNSRGGEIRASEDLRLGLFGGQLIARDLVYRPLAEQGDTLAASASLQDIDIAQLAAAFDWPKFTGRLDGNLPRLRYAGDQLGVDGMIQVQAFGGEVRVDQLSIERPFAVAPALAANVHLGQLDLQPLTEVFGFGRIEGRLNGDIQGLRLLDWRPVAFAASFRTVDSGRRRISQLAVEQLTRIGGGGGAAGIQGRLMGVFDSFGYRRIGLACTLAKGTCTMSGLDSSAGGYTILQGSGLPLITIRGFQRQVDWAVLVERLKLAVSGQAPVVK